MKNKTSTVNRQGIDKVKFAKYELKNGNVLKDGHTMFLQDVVSDLNRKSFLEKYKHDIEKSKTIKK